MENTMSKTRALNEIKLLDKRIQDKMRTSIFIAANKKSNKKIQGVYTIEEFNTNAKANYDSINDLITRRKLIKSLIVMSNATEKVMIGDNEYFVADAIERKNSIKYEKDLLATMIQQYNRALAEVTQRNEQMEQTLNKQLEIMLGSENKKTEGMESFSTQYRESNSYELVDSLKLKTEIERLQAEIDNFENNVDFVLSEHNSICKIVIPE